jgi:signal transduction histidine kinase
MTDAELARATIRALEEELAETNRGLIALTGELEQKNEELQTMTHQLWQAAKLATIGELTASIAHELNNPLATVTLRTESLLAETAADAPQRRSLEVIEQEVERMASLVANLLQFSRRRSRQISTLDVGDEIERTLELMQRHLRNRKIAVETDFGADAPMIRADRQQLRQIVLNLVTNASDAMPGGGVLTIRVDKAPTTLPGVVISITDTGTGIPPEDVQRILEPFFTTKPEGKGTGLGLPICRRIAQEHHGTLDIESEVGKGTTVRVVLPSADNEDGFHLRQAEEN